MPNNPHNGLTLQELMMSEQLIPANNLADIPSLATALSNLMGASVIASVSFSVAVNPVTRDLSVSAASAALWGA